jgi:hypothetical protein
LFLFKSEVEGAIMETHNRILFHCLTCGNVVHSDVNVRPPECCGYAMVGAAAETIGDTDVPAEKATDDCKAALLVTSVHTEAR